MELTERLLSDAGGWQTLKHAKVLHESGRVSDAAWEPPMLQGRVREGDKDYRSGLKILSKSNVENLCGCRQSRQYGAICAHSVAVGLEILKPRPKAAEPVAAAANPATPAPASPANNYRPVLSTETGEPMELHVVLPPNLNTAWQKNGVTVGFEVDVAGRRTLLPTLDKAKTYRCSEEDQRIVDALRKMTGGELAGMASLPREKFLDLLEAAQGHPRITFGKTTLGVISQDPVRPELAITQRPDGSVALRSSLPAGAEPLSGNGRIWILQGRRFSAVSPGLPAPYLDLLTREVVLPSEHAASFVSRELPGLRKFFEFDMPEWAEEAKPAQATGPRFLLQLEGSLNHLTAKLSARYGVHIITLASTPARTQHARDLAAERAAIDRLQASGFTGPDGQGMLVLKGEPKILSFFARDLPGWERDAEVEIGERFEHV
ncbi:MAG: SNF2 helicase associated domain-containing protein, partial [Chthoniobacteraceae bacterium]